MARGGLLGRPAYRVAVERQHAAERLAAGVVTHTNGLRAEWGQRLGRLLARPATGIPILLLVVYLGLYQFVGQFGGGTLVDWLEGPVFEQRLNPWFTRLFAGIPWESVRPLFVGEFGLLTLG